MKGKFTHKNMRDTIKVIGFVLVSGMITALIDFMPIVELGAYAPIVMGILNVIHVAVKKYLSHE